MLPHGVASAFNFREKQQVGFLRFALVASKAP